MTTYPAHSPSTSRAPPWPSTGSEHDSNAKKSEHSGIGPYGESVKRSLDTFDYYKSLNEVILTVPIHLFFFWLISINS